jgi:tryptophan 2,3-dioxygenase
MPIKAGYLLLAAGGGVFVWSGIKGKSISSVFRQVAGGDNPGNAASANSITGDTALTTATATASNAGTSDLSYSSNEQQTALQIAEFLVRNGYSNAAAAGIAGCIAGESSFNPEAVGSGGAGLIGWTPPSSAKPNPNIVTGNPTADLQTQLTDILAYNQIWARYIPLLNAQTDPVAAADFYSQNFERPAVTDSDVRANVAQQVFQELENGGTSNVPTG